jgi:hypothetical protein
MSPLASPRNDATSFLYLALSPQSWFHRRSRFPCIYETRSWRFAYRGGTWPTVPALPRPLPGQTMRLSPTGSAKPCKRIFIWIRPISRSTTYPTTRSDTEIQQDVMVTLDNDVYLTVLPIRVTVTRGMVTLDGTVGSAYQKHRAGIRRRAWSGMLPASTISSRSTRQ